MLVSLRKLLQQQTDSVLVRILDSILDLNAPDSAGFQWFPLERKKGPKGPDFNHLQNSVELCSAIFGAGNETRTRDPDLGKVVLYQLSYSRVLVSERHSIGIDSFVNPLIQKSFIFFQRRS